MRPPTGAAPAAAPASSTAEAEILEARAYLRAGPLVVGALLGRPASTVWKVLRRHGASLQREWTYRFACPTSIHRARALPGYLRWYNRHRPHSSLGGKAPISRVSQVRGHHT